MHITTRRASLILATLVLAAGCTSGAADDAGTDTGADADNSAVESAAGSLVQGTGPAAGEPDLAQVRAVTERFQDVNVALAEGYIQDPSGMCSTAEMEGRAATDGAMGIHYFRPDVLGIAGPPNPRVTGTGTHTDFHSPSVLIYEPQADGSMELVAVENLVFIAAWEQAGNTEAPTFHGVAWDRMEDDPATEVDEAHGFDPHYDRHVWIYRTNPDGVFAPFNRDVSCQYAQVAVGHTDH